jgi:poly(ADP-ribose) glycohydrolase ARH3
LLGLALGDSLGAPFEGRSSLAVAQRYPTARDLLRDPPGSTLLYSDDTQMMIAIAETLVQTPEPTAQHYADALVANYEPFRGYGPGARQTLAALRKGTPVTRAATVAFADGSLGNGAAVRVAPIGLRFAEQPERLLSQARTASTPTHVHPLGIEGAIIMAFAVSGAFHSAGEPFDRALFLSALKLRATSEGFQERLQRAGEISHEGELGEFGTGLTAETSVITAIACFVLFPDDFISAVGEAIRLGGDCDTIAAMTGALSGARLGVDALPIAWLERLENGGKGRDAIDALARKLADLA